MLFPMLKKSGFETSAVKSFKSNEGAGARKSGSLATMYAEVLLSVIGSHEHTL